MWVNVSLAHAPPVGSTVVVNIDSSSGADAFYVSACSLTFTWGDWDTPQQVFFAPVIQPANVHKQVRNGSTLSVIGVVKGVESWCCRITAAACLHWCCESEPSPLPPS